jgi:hypothetical protein
VPSQVQLASTHTFAQMFRKLDDPTGEVLTVFVDGVPVVAEPNESVAAVLLRLSPSWSRTTPISGARRAPYCMIGVCFECLASVDGNPSVQTCLTPVRAGMHIERQQGCAAFPAP